MPQPKVYLEALGLELPPERVTSEELEQRLEPLLARLGLSVGRLELMSGIAERRLCPPDTRPSSLSIAAAKDALGRTTLDPSQINLLIHAGVCRDFLEPATASVVHAGLELPDTCAAFDLSNACLGVADGMAFAAQAIRSGSIQAALVTTGEDGRPLIETTINSLMAIEDDREARRALKKAYASLTIGSGGAAVLLVAEELASTSQVWLGSTSRADTKSVGLCAGDRAADGGLVMVTDSEALLQAGNALAATTFEEFLKQQDWTRDSIDRIITHQVGSAHRKLLLETLGLDPAKDFPSVQTLGNMGSASLPATLYLAVEAGFIQKGERVALLGIGSGLHCRMTALQW